MITVGETLTFRWRPGFTVDVDERMIAALSKARAALIAIAYTGRTITYKGLEKAIEDSRFNYRNFRGLLDVISLDCERRGEDSLAALVIRGDTKEVGDGFINNAGVPLQQYREGVQRYWRDR